MPPRGGVSSDSDSGGGSDRGWHPVFLPDGSDSTVGEMAEGSDEREACLPRRAAILALEVTNKKIDRGGEDGGCGRVKGLGCVCFDELPHRASLECRDESILGSKDRPGVASCLFALFGDSFVPLGLGVKSYMQHKGGRGVCLSVLHAFDQG